jgi:hypothetical protein
MRRIYLVVVLLLAAKSFLSQSNDLDPKNGVIVPTQFAITRPIREIFAENPVDETQRIGEKISSDRKLRPAQQFPLAKIGDEKFGNDESIIQKGMGHVDATNGLKVNWAGQTASGFRPYDPSGAAGPNHYVQMINSTTFKVYNKTSGVVILTGTLGNLWSPATANAGDPIVMYDKAADRWFLAQFGSGNNNIYIAVSTTSDPTGSYATYTFTSPQFPDYLKFSVWADGYYMTSNQAQKVFCFERAAMLTGSAGARSIYTSYAPPQGGGFFVPLPGDAADGTLPAYGTPCPIFSYSDNGWGAGFSDAVNIYQMSVNWVPTTPTATITLASALPTAAFDASYNGSWNDVSQPGTTQKLDGIGGICMYRAQWKSWGGYNSVVLNWAVRINANQRSIMWCELRQNQSTNAWSIYQQGIYTPDAATRWMGSMAMDNNGSIGIAYLKSDATSIYPGLFYSGRRECDPLGTLPVTEVQVIAGTGFQTGTNRVGDYAHTCLDPDGITFWSTSEFMGGTSGASAARTRIFSFSLPTCTTDASVSIALTGGNNPKCPGETNTFTALAVNGGSSPAYQWKVNGANVGTNSPTYSTSTLTAGDVVSCVLTSNLPGVTNNPATSNSITMSVGTSVTPAVSIAITTGSNPSCPNASATFSATPSNGGATPSYQWKVNGANVGTNVSTYTTSALTNGQVVTCVMTSSAACASPSTATSNAITMTISSSSSPAVNIALTGGSNPTCAGTSTTFTATPSGAVSPVYQWQVNGSNVGTNSTSYSSSSLTNGQIVTCNMTSAGSCPTIVNVGTGTTNNAVTSPLGAAYPTYYGNGRQQWLIRATELTALGLSAGAINSIGFDVLGSVGDPATLNGYTIKMAQTAATVLTTTFQTPTFTTVYGPTNYTPTINAINTHNFTSSFTWDGSSNVLIDICFSNQVVGNAAYLTRRTDATFNAASYYQADNSAGAGACTATTGVVTTFRPNMILTSGAGTVTVGSNTITMNVNSAVAPSVAIALTTGTNPTCAGSSLTFTATPTNGGAAPAYQWKVNGANVGTNSATFTSSTITTGQIVTCVLTSNAACASPTTATSNGITVTVNNTVVPAISIALTSGTNPTCAGSSLTFTATPTNGGAAPAYQWKVNGSNVGTNSATFTSSTITTGQIVTCLLTSNAACASPTTATSNGITVTVTNTVVPAVSIALTSGTNPTCAGSSLTFTATPTNGGAAPAYQWKVNGANVGTNSASFTSSSITTGQIVTCVLTSNAACASPTTATSNGITVTVTNTVVPAVSIALTTGTNPTCAGTSLTFTATPTNGGASPVYQWKVNGANVGTNSATFTSSTITDGQIVTCVLTSNAACASPTTATSNGITLIVNNNLTWYADTDNDGFGNNSVTLSSCTQPIGYVSDNTDCNDGAASINPAANEICGNSIDENCNATADEGCCAMTASATSTNASCVGVANGSANLTVLNATLPVTFLWSNGATSEDLANVLSNTYSVVATDALGCIANASVTVGNDGGSAPAAATAINGPSGACRNSTGIVFSVDAIPGATSYLWTLPTGATGTSTSSSISLSFSSTYATGNICVRALNACGQSASYCRAITAVISNPTTPAAIIGQNINICAGSTQSYSISPVANATSYTWTAPTNASIVSGQGTTTVTVSFASNFGNSGTLAVRSVNCFGMSGNRNLTLYNIPGLPAAITGPANGVCAGSTQSFSTTATAGASSYVWTVPAGAVINSGQGTTAINVTFPAVFASGVVSVRGVSACGTGSARTKNVYSVPTISGTIAGTATNLCGGGNFTYSITAPVGAISYNWTLPAGCTMVTNNGNSVTINVPANFTTGSICVTAANACGNSASKCLSLTNKPPTPASITGPSSVCPNQAGVAFSTPLVSPYTYTWTVPSSVSIASGQGTDIVSVNWGTVAGTISVKANNSCGSSSNRSKSITLAACFEGEPDNGNFAFDNERSLSIYPNPNDGNFTISAKFAGSFDLLNELGQLIETFQLSEDTYYRKEITGLKSGIYFVVEKGENATVNQKIVVTH